MYDKTRWVDNVTIERWFRSLKVEYVYVNEYDSTRELRNGIKKYVDEYNHFRPHQSHEYNIPTQVYESSFAMISAS